MLLDVLSNLGVAPSSQGENVLPCTGAGLYGWAPYVLPLQRCGPRKSQVIETAGINHSRDVWVEGWRLPEVMDEWVAWEFGPGFLGRTGLHATHGLYGSNLSA